jgi:hypothetical protein
MAALWAVFTFGGNGPALTAHGSLDLKEEIQIQNLLHLHLPKSNIAECKLHEFKRQCGFKKEDVKTKIYCTVCCLDWVSFWVYVRMTDEYVYEFQDCVWMWIKAHRTFWASNPTSFWQFLKGSLFMPLVNFSFCYRGF